MTSLPDNAHRIRWSRVLLVWLALAGLMIVHGGLRERLIAPVIGALPARDMLLLGAMTVLSLIAAIPGPFGIYQRLEAAPRETETLVEETLSG